MGGNRVGNMSHRIQRRKGSVRAIIWNLQLLQGCEACGRSMFQLVMQSRFNKMKSISLYKKKKMINMYTEQIFIWVIYIYNFTTAASFQSFDKRLKAGPLIEFSSVRRSDTATRSISIRDAYTSAVPAAPGVGDCLWPRLRGT